MFGYVQVFLTLCTLVTLYFAEEVPLSVNEHQRLSDVAPLLDDSKQNGLELSKMKADIPGVHNVHAINGEGFHERELADNHSSPETNGGQHENFDDGPGAVLVNLLTSLRHLPPAMHSVLVVMALTWV